MGRIERRLLTTRGALLAAAVVFIGLKDLVGGSLPSSPIGPIMVGLVAVVVAVLLLAAALDLRNHARAATLTVAALAAATGPTFAFVYAAPAAGTVGSLLAFALVLPLLRTRRDAPRWRCSASVGGGQPGLRDRADNLPSRVIPAARPRVVVNDNVTRGTHDQEPDHRRRPHRPAGRLQHPGR